MPRGDIVNHLGRLPPGLEMRAQCEPEAGSQQDLDERRTAEVQNRLLAPRRGQQHVDVPDRFALGRVAALRHQLLQPVVTVRDQLLRRQPRQRLALADLARLVRAGAQDGVVMVERILVIGHVRADQRVEHVDVVHRVHRALQVLVVEVEQLRQHDVRLQRLEEHDAIEAGADAERQDVRMVLVQAGVFGIGGDVAESAAQPPDQLLYDRGVVMPVLATLGEDDDVAVRRRQPFERAIVAPVPEERGEPGQCSVERWASTPGSAASSGESRTGSAACSAGCASRRKNALILYQ